MAITGPCLSPMEKPCFRIIASPEPAALLYTQNTRKRHAGRLASLTSPRYGQYDLNTGCGQHIAALGQSNYVCEVILLGLVGLQLEKVLVPMQVSFSKLTKLQLWPRGETPLVIPDSFLEGSAPCLRFLSLAFISFPGLPKLLLSATHLVYLYLYGIPHIFHPKRWLLSSPYCPASKLFPLNFNPLNLALNGKAECLEEFVTRIDTPHLDEIDITLFNQSTLTARGSPNSSMVHQH